MSGGSKFSSEVPKGDAWGVEAALERAAREFVETGHSPMIACIAILSVKEVKLVPGDDGPAQQIVAKLARVNALTTPKAIKDGQKLILQAIADQQGRTDQPMLPFEAKELIDMAFGGQPVEVIEQDEREKIEDENIDEPERLRRHLVAVHGADADTVKTMEWVDVTKAHKEDHDALDDPDAAETGIPAHARDWWAWRRVDLEAAESEADGTADDGFQDVGATDGDGETVYTPTDSTADEGAGEDAPDNVTPLFNDGRDKAAGED